VAHGDHVDYLHGDHRHAAHEGHWDEHADGTGSPDGHHDDHAGAGTLGGPR
jgi:zinc transport system permease protein